MTEETQTPVAAQPESPAGAPAEVTAAPAAAAPAVPATEEPKSEAAVKAQEVGKKLTGFLGGLAEKAKNLDVKELAEKAKNLDVKELTEKAKQKVNEVKDKAAEINAGKADNVILPREEISVDQIKDLLGKAAAQMIEEAPAVLQAVLADAAQGEQIVARIKFGTTADPVYAALSAKSFYHFTKSSDQFSVEIYPISNICGFSLLPPRAETAGRLTVFTENAEIKLSIGSLENYAKALILYHKMRSFMGK